MKLSTSERVDLKYEQIIAKSDKELLVAEELFNKILSVKHLAQAKVLARIYFKKIK